MRYKKSIIISWFLFLLVGLSGFLFVFLGQQKAASPHQEVLAAAITPTPTEELIPTEMPTPTVLVRTTTTPKVTFTPAPAIASPTSAPAQPTSTPTTTPAPAQPTSTPTTALTNTPTPTLTPTPAIHAVSITVDYAGQHAVDIYTVSIEKGQSAWEAVKKAVGLANLTYTDYGGDLGVFITGFNSVIAASNQYYEFRVNGTASNTGVSSYTFNDSDKLSFVLTAF